MVDGEQSCSLSDRPIIGSCSLLFLLKRGLGRSNTGLVDSRGLPSRTTGIFFVSHDGDSGFLTPITGWNVDEEELPLFGTTTPP